MTLSGDERYSRQVLFSPIGAEGQERIRAARVLLVGCGGLGGESASLLARAGVGLLRIVDRDVVDLSNLQRQALFDEEDARDSLPKAVAAARRIGRINSDVAVEPVVADVHAGNILGLLSGIDLVVDGFDNFEGRFLLNDACVRQGLPWVYGACVGASGVSTLVVPGRTACLRCIQPDLPAAGAAPTCDTVGILGPAAHLVASLQVAQALRWIVTREAPEPAVLLSADVWTPSLRRTDLPPRDALPRCPCCVERRFEFLDAATSPAESLCGRDAVMVRSLAGSPPSFPEIAARLRPLGEVLVNAF
ncbi:MAG: ThiF family adenylyltransferase, partial [Acidobacteriia bacterium]|nr:ThiF family adenylyltransferase [Terriglobia bacterium]